MGWLLVVSWLQSNHSCLAVGTGAIPYVPGLTDNLGLPPLDKTEDLSCGFSADVPPAHGVVSYQDALVTGP